MYRFALDVTPEDTEAIATLLYVEMLEQGYTRVGEFHYLHHDHDGRPYANPAEMATRIARAAEITGIGLTVLPSFYAPQLLWRSRAACRPADMDMNRPGSGQLHDCRQFVRRHGPQAVRSDTDINPGQRADGHLCGGSQLGELVDRADEPADGCAPPLSRRRSTS